MEKLATIYKGLTTKGKLIFLLGLFIIALSTLLVSGCVTIAAQDDEHFLLYHDKEKGTQDLNGMTNQGNNAGGD